MNILVHGTVIGLGGIAHHTREFTKALSRYHTVKIRNFNVDHDVWTGYDGPNVFRNIKELEPIHHKMLYKQSLWKDGKLTDFILSGYDDSFKPDIHIVMTEANHHYHFQTYNEPVIAYFPWETTKLYQHFINRLQNFDYIWSPSEWQKQVLVDAGLNQDKIEVVNEGVDPIKFYPIKNKRTDKLRILHVGPWEYRKSTYEIIRTFLDLFENNDDVELRLSIHSKINSEYDTAENTFKKYGLPITKNIVFLNTLTEDEYIKEIQNASLYVSCSRSEGWNLPLIQSLSCGVPSIYTKCSGQLEFTNDSVGIGIDVVTQYPATKKLKVNDVDWCWDVYGDYPGDLYEPNYEQFKEELFKIYSLYKEDKLLSLSEKCVETSKLIRQNYNWGFITQKTNQILNNIKLNKMKPIYYLIHSVSFGDTLAATPTLRYLSQSHERKLNVVTHNTHIFKNNPYIDKCITFNEFNNLYDDNIIKYESFTNAGRKDGNGVEKKFAHIDLRQIHAMDLGFQLMPHQMEYDYFADPVDLPYEFPETYVVCHITQNWPNRTWPTEKWQRFVNLLAENKIFTVLVGKDHSEKVHDSISIEPIVKRCPQLDNLYGLNLANKLDLDGMYHVINNAKVLVTMCSGAMNIGGCTDTHILQVGSAQNPLLRIPYRKNTQNYKYSFVGGSCSIFCNMDLRYNVKEWGDINSVPPLTECPEKKPTYECQPQPDKVMDKLKEILLEYENN